MERPIPNKAEYRTDPSDGLPARNAGAWAKDKAFYVDRYMHIFAAGMAKKWRHRVYLDLFAGPGVCVTRGTTEFYDGSPLIALRHPFTHHIYVDKDSLAIDALEKRTASRRGERKLDIIVGDCNTVVDHVHELIPKDALVFAFIDPTNWQIRFDTVRRLVHDRRVDVLITFQVGMLKRNRMRADLAKVNAFFGADCWRPALDSGELAKLKHFAECYGQQMAMLGYQDVGDVIEPKMRISTGTLLYTLRFFSRHERGHEFWERVASETPSGQMQLLRVPVKPPRRAAPGRASAASGPRSGRPAAAPRSSMSDRPIV